jgi:hypothetical protein
VSWLPIHAPQYIERDPLEVGASVVVVSAGATVVVVLGATVAADVAADVVVVVFVVVLVVAIGVSAVVVVVFDALAVVDVVATAKRVRLARTENALARTPSPDIDAATRIVVAIAKPRVTTRCRMLFPLGATSPRRRPFFGRRAPALKRRPPPDGSRDPPEKHFPTERGELRTHAAR